MQIKSFSARSGKEVLACIKGELGPDAVILDSREEDGIITMTAAADRDSLRKRPSQRLDTLQRGDETETMEEQADCTVPGFEPIGGRSVRNQSFSYDLPSGSPGSPSAVTAKKIPFAPDDKVNGIRSPEGGSLDAKKSRAAPARGRAGQTPSAPPPGWQQWHEEWGSLKDQIMSLMKPALRLDDLPPKQRMAIEFLQREGVEDEAVVRLYQRLQQNPEASVLVHLARLVPVRAWSAEVWPQRIQAITGPFGAGKTSVSIRMALSLRKSAPDCRICLVNADAMRGNGRLLLRHYCDLSDMIYKEASTTLELAAALDTALRDGFDRIFVDLPGLSRGRFLTSLLADAGFSEHTGETPDDLAVHLALPPHYASSQLRGLLKRYTCPHAGGIIWTKLDEAEHYGQIINVAVASGLPVSALSFGPGLGNSFAPARENMLWRLLFKRELPSGA